jgi:hypothetical protein
LLLAAPALFANDITVTYISRLPEMPFAWASTNPTRDGWPTTGQQVTWRANVKNWSSSDAVDVPYRWFEDGVEIAAGTATLAANATTAVDLPRSWTFTRQRLAFKIGPIAGEESTANDRLEIFTDALAVGFWVEQSLYDYFRANQGKLGVGSTCWENWAQRQVDFYNDMAVLAIYPETPDGVLDRWRIQKIVVVPDGALPLVPFDLPQRGNESPPAATHPDTSDRTVDLEWGFRASTQPTYSDTHRVSVTNPFYLAPVLIHELGHARYLVDVYGFDVLQQPPGHEIDITENGILIADNTLPGGANPYFTPEHGLMNGNYTFIDRYSAIALNRIAGARATYGNCNDPNNVGAFLNDLPAQNVVTIRDTGGEPVADADVEIFQSEPGHADVWYAQSYDDVADLKLHTDSMGRVAVGCCPFSPDGKIVHYWRGSNAVAIVRAKKNGMSLYGFLEVRLFNMEYWRGHTDLGTYDLTVRNDIACNDSAPIPGVPLWDAEGIDPNVTLTWNGIAGATSYDVYAAMDGNPPRRIGSTTSTLLRAYLPGRVTWWVEAQRATCPPLRSDSARFTALGPARHRAASH